MRGSVRKTMISNPEWMKTCGIIGIAVCLVAIRTVHAWLYFQVILAAFCPSYHSSPGTINTKLFHYLSLAFYVVSLTAANAIICGTTGCILQNPSHKHPSIWVRFCGHFGTSTLAAHVHSTHSIHAFGTAHTPSTRSTRSTRYSEYTRRT